MTARVSMLKSHASPDIFPSLCPALSGQWLISTLGIFYSYRHCRLCGSDGSNPVI